MTAIAQVAEVPMCIPQHVYTRCAGRPGACSETYSETISESDGNETAVVAALQMEPSITRLSRFFESF